MKALLSLALLLMFGCSSLFQNRSFIEEMDKDTDGFWVPNRDFQVTAGDSGKAYRSRHEILGRTPSSKMTKEEFEYEKSLMNELRSLENKLSEEDFARYRRDQDFLGTTSEKIYYLSLSNSDRMQYMETRFNTDRNEHVMSYMQARSMKGRELYLGMDKQNVIQSWGRPNHVEIAGNPRHQNERWTFVENGRSKQVYFEAGRVNGWVVD